MPLSSIKSVKNEKVVIPRNFILLGELEEVEKSTTYLGNISYGLESHDDNILLEKWQGVILPDHGDNVYSLKIHVGSEYPYQPPTVTFTETKPQLNFVDPDGLVTSRFPLFQNWDSQMRIKDILLSLKQYLR